MNEKQKLELNWPDNVSYDNETNWEHTVIQNKLIAFVSFHYDSDVGNPCEDWDGFGDIRSLSTKHINNISPGEIEGMLLEDPINKEQMIPLSYFEHGNCKWGTMGSMELMPDFKWDGVSFAGVWIPDDECIKTVDIWEKEAKKKSEEFNRNKKFKEMATQACETYTAFCNGEVYGFNVELYRLQFDNDQEPIEDHSDYDEMDQLFEDSCWGFYDADYMKENIRDNLQYHLDKMKKEAQLNSEGKPDFNKMTNEDFDRILITTMEKQSSSQLITVPGLYEVVSVHFNNEVLEEWEKEQLK